MQTDTSTKDVDLELQSQSLRPLSTKRRTFFGLRGNDLFYHKRELNLEVFNVFSDCTTPVEDLDYVDTEGVVESTNNIPYINGLPFRYMIFSLLVNWTQLALFALFIADAKGRRANCTKASAIVATSLPLLLLVVAFNLIQKVSRQELEYFTQKLNIGGNYSRRYSTTKLGFSSIWSLLSKISIISSYLLYTVCTSYIFASAESFKDLLFNSLSLFFILQIDVVVAGALKVQITTRYYSYKDADLNDNFYFAEKRIESLSIFSVFILSLVILFGFYCGLCLL